MNTFKTTRGPIKINGVEVGDVTSIHSVNPTMELRWLVTRDPETKMDMQMLQQLWLIKDMSTGEQTEEWRGVPVEDRRNEVRMTIP